MRHIIILPDGAELSSGPEEKNSIRNVTHTETVNSGQELTVGSVCAAMMEATVINPGGLLRLTAGDTVTLIEETDGERKQVGIFTLERPRRKSANILNLTGYDNISKLDKDLTQWLSGLDGWPYTLYELAAMTCQACGLELETEEILNGDYMVDRFEAEATGRQLLSWIGELSCSFVRANPEGRVEFGWYREQDIFIEPSGENFYYQNKLSYEEYTVAAVDAVQVNMGEYLWPDAEGAENVYLITGNPLIQRVDNGTMEALERVRERLSEAVYTPCTVTVPMVTDVKPGSICRVRDANGVEITTWIMSRVRKGMRDQLESTGSNRRDSSTAQANKTSQQKNAELKVYAKSNTKKAVSKQTSADGSIVIDLVNNVIRIKGADGNSVELEAGNILVKDNDGVIRARLGKIAGDSYLAAFYSKDQNVSIRLNMFDDMITVSAPEDGKTDGSSISCSVGWKANGDGTFSLIGR